MKYLFFSLAFLLTMNSYASGFISNVGNPNNNPIVGIWLRTSILVDGVEDLLEDEIHYYKYESDGTFTNFYFDSYSSSYCLSGISTYTFDGSMLEYDSTTPLNVQFEGNDQFTIQNMDEGKTVISTFKRITDLEINSDLVSCEEEIQLD